MEEEMQMQNTEHIEHRCKSEKVILFLSDLDHYYSTYLIIYI